MFRNITVKNLLAKKNFSRIVDIIFLPICKIRIIFLELLKIIDYISYIKNNKP
jgi:hypothetical protein